MSDTFASRPAADRSLFSKVKLMFGMKDKDSRKNTNEGTKSNKKIRKYLNRTSNPKVEFTNDGKIIISGLELQLKKCDDELKEDYETKNNQKNFIIAALCILFWIFLGLFLVKLNTLWLFLIIGVPILLIAIALVFKWYSK